MDHRLLLGLDPVFAAAGQWRRVYLDLPGMGQSAAGPEIGSSDAVAEAVVAFVRETFGREKFAVLGNSFGGLIARHLVAEFGDQVLGLALLCPVAVPEHGSRNVPERTVLHRDPVLLGLLEPDEASEYDAMAVIQSPENWARFRDAVLPGLRAFDPAAIERISGSYALSVEPETRTSSFHGPTVIITGQQDHVVGFRDQAALADHYLQATMTVLDRAGHNAHLDQPELTAVLLSEWLARITDSMPDSARDPAAS